MVKPIDSKAVQTVTNRALANPEKTISLTPDADEYVEGEAFQKTLQFFSFAPFAALFAGVNPYNCDDNSDAEEPSSHERRRIPPSNDDDTEQQQPTDNTTWNDADNGTDDPVDTIPICNPSDDEIPGNNVDENCNGMNDGDQDGDGITIAHGDCDDARASVFPGASELCHNRLDDNCDGTTDEACPSPEDSVGCPESRFSTITEAINAGTRIFICNGTYNQFLQITDKQIVLEGESREGVIIRSPSPGPNVVTIENSDVTLKNLTITGGTPAHSQGLGCGIYMTGSADESPPEHFLELDHCSIAENAGCGIIVNNVDLADIRYSRMAENGHNGFPGVFITNANHTLISHSDIENNSAGLGIFGGRGAQIEHVHIANNGIPGLYVAGNGADHDSVVTLSSSDITDNKSSLGEYRDGLCIGGGGMLLAGVDATITDTQIKGNEYWRAGAITVCSFRGMNRVVVKNSEVSNNTGQESTVNFNGASDDSFQSNNTEWNNNNLNVVLINYQNSFDLTEIGSNFICTPRNGCTSGH